jgi:hypothetical protein
MNESESLELEDAGDVSSDDEDDESVEVDSAQEVERFRRSKLIRKDVEKPSRYAVATEKIRSGDKQDAQKNEEIKKVNLAEIKQVFQELEALEPVERLQIPANVKALGLHLFTVEKFTAPGEHEKFKSQLVSHGNEQDTLL